MSAPRLELPGLTAAVAADPGTRLDEVQAVLATAGIPAGELTTAAVRIECWSEFSLDRLRAAEPQEPNPLVVVAPLPSTPHLARSVVARLPGYALAEEVASALMPTVAAVAVGQACHPRALREMLTHPHLTAREKQVLAMVVLGLTNVEIAAKLYLSDATIKAYLTSAFAKLGVTSREAAAAVILDPDAGYGMGILRITPEESPQR